MVAMSNPWDDPPTQAWTDITPVDLTRASHLDPFSPDYIPPKKQKKKRKSKLKSDTTSNSIVTPDATAVTSINILTIASASTSTSTSPSTSTSTSTSTSSAVTVATSTVVETSSSTSPDSITATSASTSTSISTSTSTSTSTSISTSPSPSIPILDISREEYLTSLERRLASLTTTTLPVTAIPMLSAPPSSSASSSSTSRSTSTRSIASTRSTRFTSDNMFFTSQQLNEQSDGYVDDGDGDGDVVERHAVDTTASTEEEGDSSDSSTNLSRRVATATSAITAQSAAEQAYILTGIPHDSDEWDEDGEIPMESEPGLETHTTTHWIWYWCCWPYTRPPAAIPL